MFLINSLLAQSKDHSITIFFNRKKNTTSNLKKYILKKGIRWTLIKAIKRLVQFINFIKFRKQIVEKDISNFIEATEFGDFDVFIAYNSGLLEKEVYNFAKNGTICAHPAMLPFGRGFNGLEQAILKSKPIGVSVFKIDQGIDTGDIFIQRQIDISEITSEDELRSHISHLSIELTIETINKITNNVKPFVQHKRNSYTLLSQDEINEAKKVMSNQFIENQIKLKSKNNFVSFNQRVKNYFRKYSPDLYWGDDLDVRFFILKKLSEEVDMKILDIGCQTGTVLKLLNQRNTLFGVDINEDYINLAKKYNRNCTFSCTSMTSLPYKDESFDLVTMFNVLPGWDFDVKRDEKNMRLKAIQEAYRVLKPSGKLFITTPNGNSIDYLGKNKGNINELLSILEGYDLKITGWNNTSVMALGSEKLNRLIRYLIKFLANSNFFWVFLSRNAVFLNNYSKSICIEIRKSI